MDRNYDIITFRNIFILGRPIVANVAYIIKIATMIKKQRLKTQKRLKELEIIYWNEICICIS